jgi:hypothetical protein
MTINRYKKGNQCFLLRIEMGLAAGDVFQGGPVLKVRE